MTAIVKPSQLPAPARRDPIAYLGQLRDSTAGISRPEDVQQRLALIDAVRAYSARYGKQAEPILRGALAARLAHERRLGELLATMMQHQGGRPPKEPDRETLIADERFVGQRQGVSFNLSANAQALAATPADWFGDLIAGIVDGSKRWAIKEIYLKARRLVAGAAASATRLPENLILGDFMEKGKAIPDGSVALIFTDPPYDRKSLHLYEEVSRLGSRVLLPGGSLLAYAPHYALPQVLPAMANHLRYWWMLVVLHSAGHSLMREYGVRVAYKPLIWCVKGGRHDKQAVISDVIPGAQEKTDHEWQQSVVEARAVIDMLTVEGDLILDPMAGSGTTLLAAQAAGRRWIGIDTDSDALAVAAARLEQAGRPQD